MSWSHRPSDLGHHFILSPQNVVSSLMKKILTKQLLCWSYYDICDSCINLMHIFNMEPKILSSLKQSIRQSSSFIAKNTSCFWYCISRVCDLFTQCICRPFLFDYKFLFSLLSFYSTTSWQWCPWQHRSMCILAWKMLLVWWWWRWWLWRMRMWDLSFQATVVLPCATSAGGNNFSTQAVRGILNTMTLPSCLLERWETQNRDFLEQRNQI